MCAGSRIDLRRAPFEELGGAGGGFLGACAGGVLVSPHGSGVDVEVPVEVALGIGGGLMCWRSLPQVPSADHSKCRL